MFQRSVNVQPAIGVAGDMWGANPRASVLAGEGALVSGPDGLFVGRFAWKHADGLLYNTGVGAPTGFVAREQQAFITEFLGETSMWIPPGQPVTLFMSGDFLMKNEGDTAATENAVLYVDASTGAGAPGATGTAEAASFTAAVAANVIADTCTIDPVTCTASISGTTMTVTALGTRSLLSPGMVLTGTNVAEGTEIVSQLTGTAGSTGTYEVSIDQEVVSTTVTGSGAVLAVTSMTTGGISVGQTLSGTGVTGGTTVLANITGAGGAGAYWVDTSQTVTGVVITASGGTMTVSAVASGDIDVNEVIAGATEGSYVTMDANTPGSNVTGTGGTGTYRVSVGETVGSKTITIAGSVATKWLIRNVAAVGELMKISSYALG